jgi:predicted heme/steroid binding protein
LRTKALRWYCLCSDKLTFAGLNGIPVTMKKLYALMILLAIYCLPLPAHATEEYAKETGKSCSFCHVDPGGGGELTAAGKEHLASLAAKAQAPGLSTAARVVRFGAGYLHIWTAVLWFGTILYVHLVLKPAYAVGGLPRGEVRVGVLSMAVMGVTGLMLTHFRVSSLEMLLHTRFGLLLMAKIFLYLVMVISAAVVVIVIGPKLKAKRNGGGGLEHGHELTVDQLAGYDGKEGHPAYFAYQGKIYDATASRLWKNGLHVGRHQAGQDLTETLKLAPHGVEKVVQMPEVAVLVREGGRKAPLHERVFFFMAYMNLSIVFLIVLILALWRWW